MTLKPLRESVCLSYIGKINTETILCVTVSASIIKISGQHPSGWVGWNHHEVNKSGYHWFESVTVIDISGKVMVVWPWNLLCTFMFWRGKKLFMLVTLWPFLCPQHQAKRILKSNDWIAKTFALQIHERGDLCLGLHSPDCIIFGFSWI